MLLTGGFFLVCILSTANLALNEKITAMLPDSEPMSRDFKFFAEHVPATEILYIDIQGQADDKAQLERAADEFYEQIRDSEFFSDIVYRFSYDQYLNLVTLMRQNRAGLFDENDLAVLKRRLTPENISKQVLDIKRRLLDPAAVFTAENLIKDPLGLDQLILTRLDDFKSQAYGMKIEGARIYSKNSDHILMMATPAFPAVDTRQSERMVAFLQDAQQRVTQGFENRVRIGFSGSHVATLDNSRTIQRDVKLSVTALSIGVVVIGILFFRRRRHAVLVFVPTLFSLGFATAMMALFYKDISAIALGCGAVLIGITVDFGIHLLFGVDADGSTPPKIVAKSLRRPVFAGACTTMAAFSILLFSSLPGQRQMGAFAIIGIGTAAFFASFVLHHFIPQSGPRMRKPIVDLVRICDGLTKFSKKHFKKIAVAGMIVLIAGAFGIRSFEFDGDITRLNHLQPRAKADMDLFLETWGGSSPSLVLVKAPTLEQALHKNDQVYAQLNRLKAQGHLDRIASLSRILPSSEQRRVNRLRLREAFEPGMIERVKNDFDSAALKAGFKPGTFQAVEELFASSPDTLSPSAFNGTVLEKMIKAQVIRKDHQIMILTRFEVTDKAKIPQVLDALKTTVPDVLFLDRPYFIEKITRLVAREFKLLFLSAAAAMVFVVAIFFRNMKVAAVIVTPVLVAAFITAGLLGLLKIPVNLISMIFVVFVFGVGVDFSIFLANHELQGHDKRSNTAAGAVVLCALTTMGAFLCLVFAKHAALHSIGVAGLTGMVCSLLLALILIPSLMEKFVANEEKRRLDG